MKSAFVRRTCFLFQLVVLGMAPLSHAHTTGLSTSELRWGTNGWEAQLTFANADLLLAFGKLDGDLPTDADRDGKLSPEELAAAVQRLRKFAAECLGVEFDGRPVSPGPPTLSLDALENFHVAMNYPGPRPGRLRLQAGLFAHLPPDHLHFVSVHEADGRKLGDKMLKPTDAVLELQLGGAEAAKESPRTRTFTDFFKLGIEHIWTGYDHLTFLLALLLACANFKSAVQVVTFFTLAHSLTLAFATLNLVWVSGRVVEPVIAASIIYVGVENIVAGDGLKGRWLITFLFGLIHGFGFASVLKDLGVASGSTGVTVPLVAFNLGVETGQIVVAAVLLPLIWQLKRWPPFQRRGVTVCSALVAGSGVYWLVQRLFPG